MSPRRRGTSPAFGPEIRKEILDVLGSRAIPDLDWLKKVTREAPAAILETLREITDLLPTERAIHRAMERTGRTYYAQFPAPLEL